MSLIRHIINTLPRPALIKIAGMLRPVMDLWYRGNRYTDPINGKSYRKFLPYGYEIKRKNALSPGTLSLERHRLLWLYLQMETDFFEKSYKVLHIAPEQPFIRKFEQIHGDNYITADLNSPLAKVKADITDLPFSNGYFDIVFCNHVLEHIPDDRKALRELYRVMKKGGWGIFQVPLDTNREKTYENPAITTPEERRKHFGQYDHVRIYGNDYYQRLAEVGFEVSQIDMSHHIPAELYDKYRLPEGEMIPLCKK